ncbi:MAG TPA: efflux RND transporter periplasmic adaptor subunit, partial [Bryobacteraceae bacterium]|nr:efflux RND transporter periplasmic adaptor subunit [Bryobacteraceae bacterium]
LIEGAKLNITYSHMTAPVSGRIGLRLVDPGNIVHASDQNGMLVITQIQPISVIFTISEDQLQDVVRRLHRGQRLPVDAWDKEMQARIAQGSLVTVDNQIDQTTGTLRLRATFDNANSALFPNQFVNARLLVEMKHGVTLLPSAAIQRNSQMTYVYLVTPDSTVAVKQIGVGVTAGDDTEVTSGLAPEDVVVMTGVDKLLEGEKVVVHMEGEAGPGGSRGGNRTGRPDAGGQGGGAQQGGKRGDSKQAGENGGNQGGRGKRQGK